MFVFLIFPFLTCMKTCECMLWSVGGHVKTFKAAIFWDDMTVIDVKLSMVVVLIEFRLFQLLWPDFQVTALSDQIQIVCVTHMNTISFSMMATIFCNFSLYQIYSEEQIWCVSCLNENRNPFSAYKTGCVTGVAMLQKGLSKMFLFLTTIFSTSGAEGYPSHINIHESNWKFSRGYHKCSHGWKKSWNEVRYQNGWRWRTTWEAEFPNKEMSTL